MSRGNMRLAQLEQDFQSFVLEGTPGIEQGVIGTPRVPVGTRLSIYAQAYSARLAEALESNYPVLAGLLGEPQFRELAADYSRRHHPTHFSIRWYGDRLAALLAQHPPYDRQPLLAELAQWEWNMTLAFDAADAPLLQRTALAAVAPDEWSSLCFKLHPSVRLLALRTDVAAVWRAIDRHETPPAHLLAHDAALESGVRSWVIWRRGLATFFRSLEAVEAAALAAVGRGESFGMLCEEIARAKGEDAAPGWAATQLARWIEDEMLAA